MKIISFQKISDVNFTRSVYLFQTSVRIMTRSRREVTKILKSYRTPSFPGSFSSAQKFRHALRERLGIDIQLGELKDILEKDLS